MSQFAVAAVSDRRNLFNQKPGGQRPPLQQTKLTHYPKFGYIHIRSGKSGNAKRNVLITPRAREMLGGCQAEAKTRYVFPSEVGTGPVSIYTLEAQHSRVRKALGLDGCVIHSFRHTFGTRLGESRADAFSIMKAMGHSSVTISQRCVHPTREPMERIWTSLNDPNQKAVASLPAITSERQKPTTVKGEVPTRVPTVRVCDFFKFAHRSGLKTKDLSTRKWPTNQKSHKL